MSLKSPQWATQASEVCQRVLRLQSVTIDFLNDTASANVLATLQAAWGTNVTVVLLQEKGTAVCD
jgi:hypothetical protein